MSIGASRDSAKMVKSSSIKSYNIPKVKYVKQSKPGGVSIINFEKIMIAYWNYLKSLEDFANKAHSDDYVVNMAISYIKIKKHKSYMKKCYNMYKLNEYDAKKVQKIAQQFRGAEGASNSGTLINFLQAVMRIKSPLEQIDKILKKDKTLMKKILDNKDLDDKVKNDLIGPQNEFFKFAAKNKISNKLDKEFFMNFENLYNLSIEIPSVVNNSINELLQDLDYICKGKFKISLKNKIKGKIKNSTEDRKFVKKFLEQIKNYEEQVEKIFKKNSISKASLRPAARVNFVLDEPHIAYKKITTTEECEKFLRNKKNKNFSTMEEYFDKVYEYTNEIMKAKNQKNSSILNSIKKVEEDYEKFSAQTLKKFNNSKERNKKSK